MRIERKVWLFRGDCFCEYLFVSSQLFEQRHSGIAQLQATIFSEYLILIPVKVPPDGGGMTMYNVQTV